MSKWQLPSMKQKKMKIYNCFLLKTLVLGAPDRVNMLCLMHDTFLCQISMEQKRIRCKYITCYDVKKQVYMTNNSRQETSAYLWVVRAWVWSLRSLAFPAKVRPCWMWWVPSAAVADPPRTPTATANDIIWFSLIHYSAFSAAYAMKH